MQLLLQARVGIVMCKRLLGAGDELADLLFQLIQIKRTHRFRKRLWLAILIRCWRGLRLLTELLT
jgi:hypothetical protein